MNISMRDLAGTDVLAKATSGRSALRALLMRLETEPSKAETVFLDFTGIEAATSSYLRESILGLRDALRTRESNFHPVISNAPEAVIEEIDYLLSTRNEAFLECTLSAKGKVSELRLLGNLDPRYKQTLELVARLGEADIGDLMRESDTTDDVTRTAWNNRLTALAGMGLVIVSSHGRTKRYAPVLQEI